MTLGLKIYLKFQKTLSNERTKENYDVRN